MENPYYFDFDTLDDAQSALSKGRIPVDRDCVIDGIVIRVAGAEVFRARISTDDDGKPVKVLLQTSQ